MPVRLLQCLILATLVVAGPHAGAATWTPVGPYRVAHTAFAVLADSPNTVIVSAVNGVARSIDGGVNFEVVPGQGGFGSLAPAGAGSNLVYGFGSGGASKSVDGGLSWQRVSTVQEVSGPLVVVAPTNPAVIYTAALSGGLRRSTDGGATFSPYSTNLQALPALSIAVSPTDQNVVYAGTLGPLFKSTDGGQHLTEIQPSGVFRARAIGIDPHNASILYVLFKNEVYKSVDAGVSFTKTSASIPATENSSEVDSWIAIDPADTRSVFVAARGLLWHSPDAGANWTGPTTLPGGAFEIHIQSSGGRLFAGGDQLYRSDDNGVTWDAATLGLSEEVIRTLAANPLAPQRVFAASDKRDYISTDNGRHFQLLTGLSRPPGSIIDTHTFTVDPSRTQVVYYKVSGGLSGPPSLLRTNDGGTTWQTLFAPAAVQSRPAESFDAVAASPTPGSLYVVSAAYGGGASRSTYLYRSTDDGVTWNLAQIRTTGGKPVQNVEVLLLDPAMPSTLYLAADAFHRSLDNGTTWTRGGAPFDGADESNPMAALALIPTSPVTLLASSGIGVFRSIDGGSTWTISSAGLSAARVRRLSVDPHDAATVYAATDSAGIYQSRDGGLTWQPFNAGLDTMDMLSVLATGEGVLAGTFLGAFRCAENACTGGAGITTTNVVEYHNTILDHYFMTANAAEIAGIDTGSAGPGWERTGATFKAWLSAADAPYYASQIYRFYGTPNIGPNSHFYTISQAEFTQVQKDRGWTYEFGNWFWAMPPASPGVCPAGTTPLYRAYNDRFAFNDSNHRYTESLAVLQSMTARGWIPEGIVMCMPETASGVAATVRK